MTAHIKRLFLRVLLISATTGLFAEVEYLPSFSTIQPRPVSPEQAYQEYLMSKQPEMKTPITVSPVEQQTQEDAMPELIRKFSDEFVIFEEPQVNVYMSASPLEMQSQIEAMPELVELARGLKHDPELIFRYVHDHIDYIPGFMSYKGDYMTYMDQAGNAFDQSSLLVTLLRLSGYDTSFVYGDINLSLTELAGWLGVEEDSVVIYNCLSNAGVPTDTLLSYISHIWVKVNIDGQEIHLDPSFKQHTIKQGIDWKAQTSYNRETFLEDETDGAFAGAIINDDFVKDINKTNINNNLALYTENLINYIKTNDSDATLGDIIGGKEIDSYTGDVFQTSLPYFLQQREVWSEIPEYYKAYIIVEHLGIYKKLYSSNVYGRSLTIFYNDQCQPVLSLDGQPLQTGYSVSFESIQDIKIHIRRIHDETEVIPVPEISIEAGYAYAIVNGWAGTGTKIIEKHRQILSENKKMGKEDSSEYILGESLQLISLTWLAECYKTSKLIDQICHTQTIPLHFIGVCGQKKSPYIDMPVCISLITNKTTSIDLMKESFIVQAGHLSALEWGVVEQLQPFNAVSTVKLMDIANDLPNDENIIYGATTTNWNPESGFKVIDELEGYDSTGTIQGYIDSGFLVVLPKRGDIGEEEWLGYTCTAISEDPLGVGELIGSTQTQNGGFGVRNWSTTNHLDSLNLGASWIENLRIQTEGHMTSWDPIDMVTGNFLYDQGDINIGNLGFSRSYRSASRLNQGVMGNGWKHNYEVTCNISSDGFQCLGEKSPIDAAATIVEIMVSTDVLNSSIEAKTVVVANLCHKWQMDQLLDNIFVVNNGASSQQYVKLPDGSYNPPLGQNSVIKKDSDTVYRLLGANGTSVKFEMDEEDGRIENGRVTEIKDVHGDYNKIAFVYDTDKQLTEVNNQYGRSLTFTYYDDGLLETVTDSEERSVQYDYDQNSNLISYEDIDNEVTTYKYNDTYDGLLEEIYYPTFPDLPNVSNVYDSLHRAIIQTNADGYTYKYYYADVRTEEVNPEGNSTVYLFDDRGLTVSTTDVLGRETTTEYDGLKRKTKETSPTGVSSEYEYDEYHNVKKITVNPKAGSGLVPIVTESTYQKYDKTDFFWILPKIQEDALGNQTLYEYDFDNASYETECGHLMKVEYPEVHDPADDTLKKPTVQSTYDDHGRVLTTTDPKGVVTKSEYYPDAQGGQLKQTTADYGGLNIISSVTYDNYGNVETTTDPDGNITSFEYYLNGLQEKITSPAPYNYEQYFEYYEDGKVKLTKSHTGLTSGPEWDEVSYTYTPAGNVETVTDIGGNTATTVYDSLGRAWKTIDANGKVTETVYNPDSSVWKVINSAGICEIENTYYEDGTLYSVKDAKGNETRYEYDGFSRLEKTIYPDGSFEKTRYDAVGRILDGQKRSGATFASQYDSTSRVVATRYAGRELISYWRFDETDPEDIREEVNSRTTTVFGNPVFGQGKSANAVSFNGSSYLQSDSHDELAGSESMSVTFYLKPDVLTSGTVVYKSSCFEIGISTNKVIAKVTTDAEYSCTSTGDLTNQWQQVSVVYDGSLLSIYINGDLDASVPVSGQLSTNANPVLLGYDNSSSYYSGAIDELRIHARALTSVEIRQLLNASDIEYEYDIDGKVLSVYDHQGLVETEYDVFGRVEKAIRPDGKSLGYSYDLNSNLKTMRYPDGTFLEYHYDTNGRLRTISDEIVLSGMVGRWRMDDSAAAGQPDVIDSSGYGRHGTPTNGMNTEAGPVENALTFDGSTYVEIPDSDDWTFTGDFTICLWVKFHDDYFTNPPPWYAAAFIGHDEGNGATNKWIFTYDQGSSKTLFHINPSGAMIYGESWTAEAGPWYFIALTRNKDEDEYTFYKDGVQNGTPVYNTVDIFDPGDKFLTIGWAEGGGTFKGAMDDVRIYHRALSADEVQNLYENSALAGQEIVNYEYYAFNTRKQVNYANGDTIQYAYDSQLWLDTLTNTAAAETLAYSYTYDNIGNRTSMTSPLDGVHGYGYDNKYQLNTVDYPQGFFASDVTFDYDPVGNRETVTTPVDSDTYVSNTLNQYDSVDTTPYQYDIDGNLTDDGTNTYEYDSENQLIKVTTPAQTVQYDYDYKGRRISKEADGKVTKYLYGGSQVLCEYTEVGGSERLARKYIYGPGVDEPIRMTSYTSQADLNADGTVDLDDAKLLATIWLADDENPQYVANYDLSGDGLISNSDSDIIAAAFKTAGQPAIYYYHFDGLGSVIALTDAAGNVVETYQYSAYGDVQIRSAAGIERSASQYSNMYMFTARRIDPETGLYYFRARVYNPRIGRFLQTDPIGYSDGINWYAYCANNPIMLIDPFGLCQSGLSSRNNRGIWTQAGMDFFPEIGEGISHGFDNLNNIVTEGLYDKMGWTVTPLEQRRREGGAYQQSSEDFAGLGAASFYTALGVKGVNYVWATVTSAATADASTGGNVFWSGSESARVAAEQWARLNNGTTLEMTQAGQTLTNANASLSQWSAASSNFAQNAMGQVNVFQAEAVRLQSVWATVEYSILMNNPNVTNITYHVVTSSGVTPIN